MVQRPAQGGEGAVWATEELQTEEPPTEQTAAGAARRARTGETLEGGAISTLLEPAPACQGHPSHERLGPTCGLTAL